MYQAVYSIESEEEKSTSQSSKNQLRRVTGELHFFREVSQSSSQNPRMQRTLRSNYVLFISVPPTFALSDVGDLGAFDANFVDTKHEHCFAFGSISSNITSLLLYFPNIENAVKCFNNCNGHPFDKERSEICHVVYLSEVSCHSSNPRTSSGITPRRNACEVPNYSNQFSSLAEHELCEVEDRGIQTHSLNMSSTNQSEEQWEAQDRDMPEHREPPPGFTELPLCPRCLERVDTSVSGMIAPWLSSTSSVPISQYSALSYWPWLQCRVCALVAFVEQEGPVSAECSSCSARENVWVCLICGHLGCSRYHKSHGIQHYERTSHRYTLEVSHQYVWDYQQDMYVHRLQRRDAPLASLDFDDIVEVEEEDCDADEEGLELLSSSKLESIASFYNDLLTSQLQQQCKFYEDQIAVYEQDSGMSINYMRSTLDDLMANQLLLTKDMEQECEVQLTLDKQLTRLGKRMEKTQRNANFYVDLNNNIKKSLGSIAPDLIHLQDGYNKVLDTNKDLKSQELVRLQLQIKELLAQLSVAEES